MSGEAFYHGGGNIAIASNGRRLESRGCPPVPAHIEGPRTWKVTLSVSRVREEKSLVSRRIERGAAYAEGTCPVEKR